MDISPELLEKIRAAFLANLKKSERAAELLRQIEAGTAGYAQAGDYAYEVGSALADAFRSELSSAVLPDGKMYQNIAEKVVAPLLGENHDLVSSAAVQVQQALNEAAGIGLKAQAAPLDTDRVQGIVRKVANSPSYDDVAWILDEPVKTFSQAVVDNTLKKNVKFQGKSGLHPRVIRRSEFRCCEWCSAHAGTFEYPENTDKDVFRRHNNCRCTLEYADADEQKTLWSKGDAAQRKAQEKEREERIKKYNAMTAEDRRKTDAAAAARKKFSEKQEYRKVTRGETAEFSAPTMANIKARRVTTYDTPVYISDSAVIKPRALHNINKNTEDALNAYAVPADKKPTVVILSEKEMPTAWGKYDAVNNTVYYVPQIADDRAMQQLGIVEYHEMWHMKQADDFRNSGWVITNENYNEYLKTLRDKCKFRLDSVGINEYNVGEISPYAKKMYAYGYFDEPEAEWKSLEALGKELKL